jgi:hypothetical protein
MAEKLEEALDQLSDQEIEARLAAAVWVDDKRASVLRYLDEKKLGRKKEAQSAELELARSAKDAASASSGGDKLYQSLTSYFTQHRNAPATPLAGTRGRRNNRDAHPVAAASPILLMRQSVGFPFLGSGSGITPSPGPFLRAVTFSNPSPGAFAAPGLCRGRWY